MVVLLIVKLQNYTQRKLQSKLRVKFKNFTLRSF